MFWLINYNYYIYFIIVVDITHHYSPPYRSFIVSTQQLQQPQQSQQINTFFATPLSSLNYHYQYQLTTPLLSQSPYLLNNLTPSPPVLKSVTVRSETKIYKHKVAISNTTTFSSLVNFAINNATAPPNKRIIIRSADDLLEYIPNDLIREVIKGIEHTEIVVSLEDAEGVDFDSF